jgi:hypothetical protein
VIGPIVLGVSIAAAHPIVQFVPTIGFLHFEYVHHGTVSEVDLQLD